MAMGRPVITTDWVGFRETVEDGVCCFPVPVRHPIALANAMKKFIQNPDLIVSMGQAGRELAEERFDVKKFNEQVLSVFGL